MEDKSIKLIQQNNLIISLMLAILIVATSAIGYYLIIEVRHSVEQTATTSKEIESLKKELAEMSSKLSSYITLKLARAQGIDGFLAINRTNISETKDNSKEILNIVKEMRNNSRCCFATSGNTMSSQTTNNNALVTVQRKD